MFTKCGKRQIMKVFLVDPVFLGLILTTSRNTIYRHKPDADQLEILFKFDPTPRLEIHENSLYGLLEGF